MRKHGGIKEILRCKQMPGITGTRDSFGIGNEFIDEKTGKVIDNFRAHEKAGYQNNPEMGNADMNQMVKHFKKEAKHKKKLDPKRVFK